MKAEQDAEYLQSVKGAVEDFRGALEAFLELHVEFGLHVARGVAPPVVARDDADPVELRRRQAVVAQAAGRAGEAATLTHGYLHVQGVGRVDPILNWSSITQPKPVLEPDDVFNACDRMIGRLDALIAKAKAERPPTLGVEGMHPIVWAAAQGPWRIGNFRLAVAVAAETVTDEMKAKTGRRDAQDTSLWQQAFSDRAPEPGKPRLRWPGDSDDLNVKNMNEGLRQFASGAQMVIRNSATHVKTDMTEQDALERLAVLSLLARWVETCQLEVDNPA